MTDEDFIEIQVKCPNCGHPFPIMVYPERGTTVTICEECMEHLEVSVKNGEVTDIQVKT